MAFEQQSTPTKSARITILFPELPPVDRRAELERWYFNLRTSLQEAFNRLAAEIDRLNAKD